MRKLAEDAQNPAPGIRSIDASSAGILALEGCSATEGTQSAMRELGVDISCHRSRLFNQELLDEHTLVLTLAREHKVFIQKNFTGWEGKLFVLKEYAGIQDADIQDVADPGYFPTPENYMKTALEIKELVREVLGKIKCDHY